MLIGNFFIWLLFYLFTDKIRVYHPELSPMKHFRASFRQLQYYGYGIFKGDPNPHHVSAYHKFNALQSMTYQIIMLLLVPLQFFTGVLLWDVEALRRRGGVLRRRARGGHGARAAVHLLHRLHLRPPVPGQPRPHAVRRTSRR